MKKLSVLFLAMVIGCAGVNSSSVCDTAENSILCDMADKAGVRIEDVGMGFIIANAVAIGEGLYTREQAVKVLTEIRNILEDPISYSAFSTYVYDKIGRYPELLIIADAYIGQFSGMADNILEADRAMLIAWLDARIEALR